MKLRKAAALLLSLTITCSLAACGGASMEGGSTTTDSSSTETTTDAAESKDTAASTEATEWKWPSKDELYVGYSQADLASTWRTVESSRRAWLQDHHRKRRGRQRAAAFRCRVSSGTGM